MTVTCTKSVKESQTSPGTTVIGTDLAAMAIMTGTTTTTTITTTMMRLPSKNGSIAGKTHIPCATTRIHGATTPIATTITRTAKIQTGAAATGMVKGVTWLM